MAIDHEALRQCWKGLLPPLTRDSARSASIFDELIAAYCGHQRHYHNLDHISALLALAGSERALFEDPIAVGLAIFFHDAIYDPTSAHNEEASASLARDKLATLNCDPACVTKVAEYIEATAHGSLPPSLDSDLKRLLDLDLSILAAAERIYDTYAAAIRAEYSHVADQAFRLGRAKVLDSFLSRPRIYLCDDHHAAWDQCARANLRRESERLGTGQT